MEQPTPLDSLTDKFSRRATDFVQEDDPAPFFLYMAYHHTHYPPFAGRTFYNTSSRGEFGDALAEMDDSIGQIMAALTLAGKEDNPLVFFTSDNG